MPKKNPIFSIVLIIVLYLYIYNPIPRWPGFGFGVILLLLSIIYVISNPRVSKQYIHYYKKELFLSLLMILYVLVVCLVSGTDDFSVVGDLARWVFFSTCVPIFIVRVLLDKYEGLEFFDTLLFVGFLASAISCIALFVPQVNMFLRGIQLEITGGESEDQMLFRFFGLAINLSSAYGYMQGLMASLCLLRLDRKHKRYAVYFITMLISVVINARTGLFPILLTVLYIFLSSLLKFKVAQLMRFSIVVSFVIVTAVLLINRLPDVADFVVDFFNQINILFFEKDGGLETSAYVTMLKFPDTFTGFIFGEGHPAESSDIGYVNQIFIGGLIFAGLLLLYEVILYRQVLKLSKEKVFSSIFFLSLLVFNYKGFNFYDGGAYIKVWMLYYYVLVHNQVCKSKPIAIA